MSDWDRGKQNYFISRSGPRWRVIAAKGMASHHVVAEYPTHCYDMGLMKAVCFAATDEDVVAIIANYLAVTEAKYG